MAKPKPNKSTSIKSKSRPRKAKKSPRATVVTLEHKEGAHPLEGSEERRLMLKRRAFQLKMQAWPISEIAPKLAEEFRLASAPPHKTIYGWIKESYEEGWDEARDESRNHSRLIIDRVELLIRPLLPLALGEVAIQREKMVDGVSVKYLDEKPVKEMIMASEQIRKHLETQGRTLGIGKLGVETKGGGELGEKETLHSFISKTVNNFISVGPIPDSLKAKTLELVAGDIEIDALTKPLDGL